MNTFVPVAEIDLTQYPKGQVSFQLKREGNKLIVYMAIAPTLVTQTPPTK
jgi:hypothetical protein